MVHLKARIPGTLFQSGFGPKRQTAARKRAAGFLFSGAEEEDFMKYFYAAMTGIVLIAITACGGKDAGSGNAEPEKAGPAASVMPAGRPDDGAAPEPDLAAAPAAVLPDPAPIPETETPEDPLHQKLIGTAWRVGEVDVTILDARTLFLKGGAAAKIATGGFETRYHYENGSIAVQVLGNTLAGVWDGENLVIDGTPAVSLQAGTEKEGEE
jgi:hypothetical protein